MGWLYCGYHIGKNCFTKMLQSIVLYLGYLSILALTAKIGIFLSSLIYRRFICESLDFTKFVGKWALVTGSTDGIGKAYAFALAKKGIFKKKS